MSLAEQERLYSAIGRLKMEWGLAEKKVRTEPLATRRCWVSREEPRARVRQCELTGVSRSGVYAKSQSTPVSDWDWLVCRLIDEQYTQRPFYGRRRMVVYLRKEGHAVNRQPVQRLMRQMGLAGRAPGPTMSRPHPEHKSVSVLAAGAEDHQPQPRVAHGHNVRAPGAGLCVLGGDQRLV